MTANILNQKDNDTIKINKHRKRKEKELSDSSPSDSDSSNESDYKIKRRNKNMSYQKKKWHPIKLCAKLTAKLLATTYKLNIITFKLDENPLQRRIYFLNFIQSLEMIFHNIRKIVKYF